MPAADSEQPPAHPVPEDVAEEIAPYVPNDKKAWTQVLGSYNVKFDYRPKGRRPTTGWHAVLLVKTRSLDRLMKRGLHINEHNVDRQRSPS